MTIHDLVDATNEWCAQNRVVVEHRDFRCDVNVAMVRNFCRYSLLDPPGNPEDGRRRGYSEKHIAQMRAIRLLQARSHSIKDIRAALNGRPLDQLKEIEREELDLLKILRGEAVFQEQRCRVGVPQWA